MSREELVRNFSIERISKTGAIFSHEKLGWMNGVYMRRLSTEEAVEQLMPFLEAGLPNTVKRPISRDYVRQIVPLIQERMRTFAASSQLAEFFFIDELDYDTTLLLEKGMDRERAVVALKMSKERLEACSFDASSLEGVLRPLAAELGLKTGELFGLLRVAVTGRTAAPPLFQTMAVLGRERCLKRIERALERLARKS
jgi:glutamyl-tRNA synthetase